MAIEALGFVIVQTGKLDDWDVFLGDVVGAMRVDSTDGAARHYRIDDRPFRFRLVEGAEERFLAAAYRLDSLASLDALAERLAAAGHDVVFGDAEAAAARFVDSYFSVHDPAGNGLEFYCGDRTADEPFVSPVGVERFVTGGLGMGHAVFAAPDYEASYSFYHDLIGFHDTDLANFKFLPDPSVPGVRFAFLHADNARHHSLAIGELPPTPVGCNHLMLEVPTRADVDACNERMNKAGVPESSTMGMHTNDKMVSFYMQCPSGFDVEIGSDGLVLDPATWTPTAFDTPSEWGHEWAWQKALAEQLGQGD